MSIPGNDEENSKASDLFSDRESGDPKVLLDMNNAVQKSKNELRSMTEKYANLEKSLLHSQGVARQRLGEISKLNEKIIHQESECSKKQAKLTLWVSNLSATIEHGEMKRELLKDEVIRLHEALYASFSKYCATCFFLPGLISPVR